MKTLGKRSLTGRRLTPWIFLLPALLSFALFKYYPILTGFYISLYHINIVKLPGAFVGLANYARAVRDPAFYQSLLHNVQFFVIGLVLNFWPPLFLALLVNEVRKHRTFFRMMYFLPAVVPGIVVNVLWKYIWQPDYGLANSVLLSLHIPPQLWLNNPNLTKWCMYFPGLIAGGGMNMLIYLASLQGIPEQHFEVALIEGAGFLSRIRYIVIPQILPIVKIMFIFDIIGRFNEAGTPFVMTGGGPFGTTETLILYAYRAARTDLDYSYAITLANIAFIIIFLITAVQMRASKPAD